jgi:hypothetical protein
MFRFFLRSVIDPISFPANARRSAQAPIPPSKRKTRRSYVAGQIQLKNASAWKWFTAVILLAGTVFLSGCGGGSGVAANTTLADFACDESAAYAKATKLTVDLTKPAVSYPDKLLLDTTWPWLVSIDGKEYSLWTRIVYPDPGVPIRGVWMYVHGINPAYTTASPSQLIYDAYEERRAWNLGYIAVSVARRGNFGSDGTPYSPNTATWVTQYQSRQITYAQVADLTWGYQADSVIAALNYMKNVSFLAPYLSNLVLSGFSGGAETVMYVAAKSPVFASATRKAIIRGAGRDSAYDTNPEAPPGYDESLYKLAAMPGVVPALWYGGTNDPITSPGKLACAFGFANHANAANSSLLFIDGMGHGGPETLTADFQNVVTGYLKSRGMPGF